MERALYIFLYSMRHIFRASRRTGLEKHDIEKKSATSDGYAPTPGGGDRAVARVWVVAENGRPRKWYAVG